MGKHTELHNEIMNLQIGESGVSIAGEALTDSGGVHIAYKLGHRDARHAAAELAAAHEDNYAKLVEALREVSELDQMSMENAIGWLEDNCLDIRTLLAQLDGELG